MTEQYKFIITGTDATKKAFMSIRKNLGSVRAGINSTQVKVAALAGAAGLGALVARSLKAGDALAKTSDRLGIATEKMAGLQHAAELTGTSQQALDMGLQRMVRRLGQVAAVGSGEAKVALDQLGISIDELKGKKPDEQFAMIAEKMKGVADQGEKIFITQKLFDSEGVKLLNLLDQGADGIGEMIDEAGELGIALNRVDLAKMEAANDAMLRAKRRTEGLGNQVTIALAPIIEELSVQFAKAGISSQDMTKTIEQGVKIGARVVGTFADGIHGVNVLFKGGEVIARGFGAAFIGAIDLVQTAIFGFANVIKHGLIAPFKGWIEIAALVPGISTEANAALESINRTLSNDWKPPAAVHDTLLMLTEGLKGAKNELHQLMLEDLPSGLIDQRLTEVLAAANVRASEIAAKVNAGLTGGSTGEQDDPITQAEKDKIQGRLDRLSQSYLTEFELLEQKYLNEQQLLEEAEGAKLITEGEFNERSKKATKKFEKEKTDLEKKSAAARKTLLMSSLTTIADAFAGKSKKMFKLQKLAAIAEVGVALPDAIVKSFNAAGGYPLGIPAAVAMAAAGAKQLASIKSQSFGGGGSAPSVGGGGSGSSPTAAVRNNNALASLPRLSAPGDTDGKTIITGPQFHFAKGTVIGAIPEEFILGVKRPIIEEDLELIPADSRNGLDLRGD